MAKHWGDSFRRIYRHSLQGTLTIPNVKMTAVVMVGRVVPNAEAGAGAEVGAGAEAEAEL